MPFPYETSGIAPQLDNVPLFQGLGGDVLARVRDQAHSKAAGTGELFFNEGDDAEAFFVLTSGRVKLTQLTPEGHQVVLRIIGVGDAFGGAGAFGDLTYPVGAEAVEPAVALVWTSGTIRQLLETEPRVALNAVQFVAGRLHDLQRRHRQLMTERVERRVARALLRLVHEAGRRVDAGVEIDFPVSRQDIAEMTGTTLFTVSRLLSAWEGQVEALARALDGEAECGDVLRLIASARGAMDSLMAEVLEGHIRDHAFRGAKAKSEDGEAAEDLVDIIRSYLK